VLYKINTILKLRLEPGYLQSLVLEQRYQVSKPGYCIFPVDVPISSVDEDWVAYGNVIIRWLVWQEKTLLEFKVVRTRSSTFPVNRLNRVKS
jgi:hypothetical protein